MANALVLKGASHVRTNAAVDLSGSSTVVVRAMIKPSEISGEQVFLSQWVDNSGDNAFIFRVRTVGTLRITIESDITGFTETADTAEEVLPNAKAYEASMDLTTGIVTWGYADDIAGPYTPFASGTTSTFGPPEEIRSSNLPLEIGSDTNGGEGNFTGAIFAVKLIVDSVTKVDVDFRLATAGATSYVDTTGHTWLLDETSAIRDVTPALALVKPGNIVAQLSTNDFAGVGGDFLGVNKDRLDKFIDNRELQSFTPTISGWTLGSGATQIGKYVVLPGRVVIGWGIIIIGTGPTIPSGVILALLPLSADIDYHEQDSGTVVEGDVIGEAIARDNGTTANRQTGAVILDSATGVAFASEKDQINRAWTNSSPFTWVVGDSLSYNFLYRARKP